MTSIPAATLILFREGVDAAEHLFVQRAATMAFAGGALVFPGGRIDPHDYDLAAGYDGDDAAARIAAIRETVEEAGVAVGIEDLRDIEMLRAGLAQGRQFGALLGDQRAVLNLDALTPFARWCPNFKETRTFDTHFYLAEVAADHAEARVDATENVHLFWATAADVLARAARGDAKLIFPTRRTLERLAGLPDFRAAIADAQMHTIATITPWIETRDDGDWLCIPNDQGYPVTAERLASAMRG